MWVGRYTTNSKNFYLYIVNSSCHVQYKMYNCNDIKTDVANEVVLDNKLYTTYVTIHQPCYTTTTVYNNWNSKMK